MRNEAAKKYYMVLRGLFITINFHEGKFLKSFREALNEYVILNPKCSYDDLVSRFGTPQTVFSDYISEQDIDDILKTIKKKNGKKLLTVSIIAILVVSAISLSVCSYFYYQLYQQVSDSVVISEEEIIGSK